MSLRPTQSAAYGLVSKQLELQTVLLGRDTQVPINEPGSKVFQSQQPMGLALSGLSGLKVGASPSQGKGWLAIDVRHDATTGTLGSGLALANGGANDTIIG